MLTQYDLSRNVYIVRGRTIDQLTYAEYLDTYWSDKTTTPNGVGPRLFVRERSDGEGCELRTWGPGGNGPSKLIDVYDNEEDATIAIYEREQNDFLNISSDAPISWDTKEEAIACLAEIEDKSPEVIQRYLRLQEHARIRGVWEAERVRAARESERIAADEAIRAEAAQIEPDAQLFADLHQTNQLRGQEKASARSAAQVAFLNRIGYGPIKTDFWKVFKIVNKKSLA